MKKPPKKFFKSRDSRARAGILDRLYEILQNIKLKFIEIYSKRKDPPIIFDRWISFLFGLFEKISRFHVFNERIDNFLNAFIHAFRIEFIAEFS